MSLGRAGTTGLAGSAIKSGSAAIRSWARRAFVTAPTGHMCLRSRLRRR
jgi:hypothetical protein